MVADILPSRSGNTDDLSTKANWMSLKETEDGPTEQAKSREMSSLQGGMRATSVDARCAAQPEMFFDCHI